MLKGDACAEPKIFNFEWEPFSTEVSGVEVEANLFNVAPCAVIVNARGIKVSAHAIRTNVAHRTWLPIVSCTERLVGWLAGCSVLVHEPGVHCQAGILRRCGVLDLCACLSSPFLSNVHLWIITLLPDSTWLSHKRARLYGCTIAQETQSFTEF